MLSKKNIMRIHKFVVDAIGEEAVAEQVAMPEELEMFINIVNKNHSCNIMPDEVIFGCGKAGGLAYEIYIFLLMTDKYLFFEMNLDCDIRKKFDINDIARVRVDEEKVFFICGNDKVTLDMGEQAEYVGAYLKAVSALNRERSEEIQKEKQQESNRAFLELLNMASGKITVEGTPKFDKYEKASPEELERIHAAMKLYEEGKDEEAIAILKPYAYRGIVPACSKLGYIYANKAKDVSDMVKACEYFRFVVDTPWRIPEIQDIRLELAKALLAGFMPQHGVNPSAALNLLQICASYDPVFYLTIARFMDCQIIPHNNVFEIFAFIERYREHADSLDKCFEMLDGKVSDELIERYFLYVVYLGLNDEVTSSEITKVAEDRLHIDLNDISISEVFYVETRDENILIRTEEDGELYSISNYLIDDGSMELLQNEVITEISLRGSGNIHITKCFDMSDLLSDDYCLGNENMHFMTAASRREPLDKLDMLVPSGKFVAAHEIPVRELVKGMLFLFNDSLYMVEAFDDVENGFDDSEDFDALGGVNDSGVSGSGGPGASELITVIGYDIDELYYEPIKLSKNDLVRIPEFSSQRYIYLGDRNLQCVFMPVYGDNVLSLDMTYVRQFLGTPVKGDFVDLYMYDNDLCVKMTIVGVND